jgi:RHS repeat-associated protein
LYSGEQFDAKIGQQYLRARYYDPATGRFNRLDPFFGKIGDPQSLHNYLYCHADSVNGIDPTGRSLGAMVATGIGMLGRTIMTPAGMGAMFGAGYGYYQDGMQGALVGGIAGGLSGGMAALALPALAGAFGSSFAATFLAGGISGSIGTGLHGLIYGTFIDESKFTFDPYGGLKRGLFEAAIGFVAGGILGMLGKAVGGVMLNNLPNPTGGVDDALEKAMINTAKQPWFRAMVDRWIKATKPEGTIMDWNIFMQKLETSNFMKYGSIKEGLRSLGFAGKEGDNWVFALWGKNIPVYNQNAISHELFHAIQDFTENIMTSSGKIAVKDSLSIELAAHLWGSPLTGPIIAAISGVGAWFAGGILYTIEDMLTDP